MEITSADRLQAYRIFKEEGALLNQASHLEALAKVVALTSRCESLQAVVNAAKAVRVHGSDYRNGTHATALWKLVDALLEPKPADTKETK